MQTKALTAEVAKDAEETRNEIRDQFTEKSISGVAVSGFETIRRLAEKYCRVVIDALHTSSQCNAHVWFRRRKRQALRTSASSATSAVRGFSTSQSIRNIDQDTGSASRRTIQSSIPSFATG
jgi:hypothetical protein